MTRQCADCKIIMGEKCPTCGSQNLMLMNREDEPGPDWFACPKHHVFQEGEGGTTHAICDSCLEKQRQELARTA